jgi:hypothetical protein
VGGRGVAIKRETKGVEFGLSTPCGSTSTEVEPRPLARYVFRLRVEVFGVPATVRVPLGASMGSGRRKRGAVWRNGAGPSPLSDPDDPVFCVEVFSLRVIVVVVTVVKVLEALASIGVSLGAPGGSGRAR